MTGEMALPGIPEEYFLPCVRRDALKSTQATFQFRGSTKIRLAKKQKRLCIYANPSYV